MVKNKATARLHHISWSGLSLSLCLSLSLPSRLGPIKAGPMCLSLANAIHPEGSPGSTHYSKLMENLICVLIRAQHITPRIAWRFQGVTQSSTLGEGPQVFTQCWLLLICSFPQLVHPLRVSCFANWIPNLGMGSWRWVVSLMQSY